MSVIVYQFQTVKFIQMMSLTFGLFTQVSGSGPLGPLVLVIRSSFFPLKTIPRSRSILYDGSRSLGLFRKGKTRIIAKFDGTDLFVVILERGNPVLQPYKY